MKYFKKYKGEERMIEITYEQALEALLGSYVDNEKVRSWLHKTSVIPCVFSTIFCEE